MAYDRSLIVADPRRCEPKKFGGLLRNSAIEQLQSALETLAALLGRAWLNTGRTLCTCSFPEVVPMRMGINGIIPSLGLSKGCAERNKPVMSSHSDPLLPSSFGM